MGTSACIKKMGKLFRLPSSPDVSLSPVFTELDTLIPIVSSVIESLRKAAKLDVAIESLSDWLMKIHVVDVTTPVIIDNILRRCWRELIKLIVAQPHVSGAFN